MITLSFLHRLHNSIQFFLFPPLLPCLNFFLTCTSFAVLIHCPCKVLQLWCWDRWSYGSPCLETFIQCLLWPRDKNSDDFIQNLPQFDTDHFFKLFSPNSLRSTHFGLTSDVPITVMVMALLLSVWQLRTSPHTDLFKSYLAFRISFECHLGFPRTLLLVLASELTKHFLYS